MLKLAFIVILVIVLLLAVRRESMSVLGYGRKDINDHRRIYFHGTSWCKWCKLWKPIWEDVKLATQGSGIEFIYVDEDTANTPYVTSYPSIFMLTERGHRLQYKGGMDFERLRNWVVSPMQTAALE